MKAATPPPTAVPIVALAEPRTSVAPKALFGREVDRDRVIGLVRGGARIVTVLGAPGIGKTSLAMHVIDHLRGEFGAEGVLFCDLSNATTEADLAFTVMSVVDREAPAPSGASVRDIAEAMRARGRALVVLDNFEQLAVSAPCVPQWSRLAPEVSFVVTSRERLAIDGEHVVELMPLACPEEGAPSDVLRASDAVNLFCERARAAAGRGSDDLASIADIVRRLDGIPLAIELAAARTRVLSPADLARRLARGEDVLTLGKRAHARHRTLADAISWSWDLLSRAEQDALVACSVFRGSFTISAATRVIEALVTEGEGTIDLVIALREKSLVHVVGDDRLALYLSIREFAAKRLEERGEAITALVRDAHMRVFAALSERFIDTRLLQDAAPQPTLHAETRRERDNLVAALAHAGTLAPSRDRAELRAALSAASGFLFALPLPIAERELSAALAETSPLDPRWTAIVLLSWLSALNAGGRLDEALAKTKAIVDLPGVPPGLAAIALVHAGIVRRAVGDARSAWPYHEHAAALIATLDLPRLQGMNVACMGRLACDLGRHDEARALNLAATDLCDRQGDRWLAALGLANLAQLEQERGDFDRAEDLLAQALGRFRETAEHQYEAIYGAICGGLCFEWQKHDLARRWYRASEGHLDALGLVSPHVILHAGWAALEATAGDLAAATHQIELARKSAARTSSAVVRLILEAHTGTVELARPSCSRDRVDAWRRRADELSGDEGASPDALVAQTSIDVRFAVRMLRAALAKRSGRVLHTAKDCLWFALDDGARVPLGRRGSLRRILAALCDEHRARPGAPIDVAGLTERGWPRERVLVEAAATRVRVAIATLRKLGLRDVLLTRDDGYLLDPDVRIETA